MLFSWEQLQAQENGYNLLSYIQLSHFDEWELFADRMRTMHPDVFPDNFPAPGDGWPLSLLGDSRNNDLNLHVRIWASLRGQTLFRTAHGIIKSYEKALRKQAQLEAPAGLVSRAEAEALVRVKYSYVITAQILGKQRERGDAQASDIRMMMEALPNLRVAYVDEVTPAAGGPKEFYSVLERWNSHLKRPEELFRVKLPGHPKIGEGKPENQNHACIFARGEILQAIDMNQDMYRSEGFKARNVLAEFTGNKVILGFTENIFSSDMASVALFAGVSEYVFGSIMQRTYADILQVRMHYGHPDCFDHVFFMGRGGISKASLGINLNEDIYAAYNTILRGGKIGFVEYVQAGKGRDLGFDAITGFETKLSCGAAEQMLSRDLSRIGHSMDIFRLFSFYYAGVGFYLTYFFLVNSVYLFLLWQTVYVVSEPFAAANAAASCEVLPGPVSLFVSISSSGFSNALPFISFAALSLPLFAQDSLGPGFFLSALRRLGSMVMLLGPIFFSFHMATRAFYLDQTILYGGAKYKGTGRGVALRRRDFCELFGIYMRSHFQLALEVIFLLAVWLLFAPTGASNVAAWWTLSFWFVAFAWLLAPFIFNPWGLELTGLFTSDIPSFFAWLASKDGWAAWSGSKLEAVLKTPTPLERAGTLVRLSGWALVFSATLASYLRPGVCGTWGATYQSLRVVILIVYGCGIFVQALRALLPYPTNNALPIRVFVFFNDAACGLFILLLLTTMSLAGCVLHLVFIRPMSNLIFGEPCDSLLTSLLYGHPVAKSGGNDSDVVGGALKTPLMYSRNDAVPAPHSNQLPPAMTPSARAEWSAQQTGRKRKPSASDAVPAPRALRISEPKLRNRRAMSNQSIN